MASNVLPSALGAAETPVRIEDAPASDSAWDEVPEAVFDGAASFLCFPFRFSFLPFEVAAVAVRLDARLASEFSLEGIFPRDGRARPPEGSAAMRATLAGRRRSGMLAAAAAREAAPCAFFTAAWSAREPLTLLPPSFDR